MTRHKILVVDDDQDLVRAMRLRLRANNFDIATASDGYSAIAVAQKERPDLILLDIGLPAGDGFVVLERLQNSDALSAIPVSCSAHVIPKPTKNAPSRREPLPSSRSRLITKNC